jgi:hypothetical protein
MIWQHPHIDNAIRLAWGYCRCEGIVLAYLINTTPCVTTCVPQAATATDRWPQSHGHSTNRVSHSEAWSLTAAAHKGLAAGGRHRHEKGPRQRPHIDDAGIVSIRVSSNRRYPPTLTSEKLPHPGDTRRNNGLGHWARMSPWESPRGQTCSVRACRSCGVSVFIGLVHLYWHDPMSWWGAVLDGSLLLLLVFHLVEEFASSFLRHACFPHSLGGLLNGSLPFQSFCCCVAGLCIARVAIKDDNSKGCDVSLN